MAECKPAASSTTPESSCERILAEFESQGRPAPSEASGGEVLGGFSVLTPKVGDGFVEWAVNGYKLDGQHKDAPPNVNYDRHGDWTFDKSVVVRPASEEALNDGNYSK